MLRERDDDPEGRVEVVNVHKERRVLLEAEDKVVLRESVLEHCAVLIEEDLLLLSILTSGSSVPNSQVHLQRYLSLERHEPKEPLTKAHL